MTPADERSTTASVTCATSRPRRSTGAPRARRPASNPARLPLSASTISTLDASSAGMMPNSSPAARVINTPYMSTGGAAIVTSERSTLRTERCARDRGDVEAKCRQNLETPRSHEKAGAPSEDRQQQILGGELSQHRRTRGTNGEPDRDFAAPTNRPSRQQAGEIEARNQQHAADGTNECDERTANRRIDLGFEQRCDGSLQTSRSAAPQLGDARSMSCTARLRSWSARSSIIPGASLATTVNQCAMRCSRRFGLLSKSGVAASGAHNSLRPVSPMKLPGTTPMMANGARLRSMVLPRCPDRHRTCAATATPRITMVVADARSSERRRLPRSGATPSVSKSVALAISPRSRSDSPGPVRLTSSPSHRRDRLEGRQRRREILKLADTTTP